MRARKTWTAVDDFMMRAHSSYPIHGKLSIGHRK